MSLHWSVVVVVCVALGVCGVLAALHLIDPSRVAEVAVGVVLWLSRSPLENKTTNSLS